MKKYAWLCLVLGLVCLAVYLALVFNTDRVGWIPIFLVLSVVCNVAASNLFFAARRKRRNKDE